MEIVGILTFIVFISILSGFIVLFSYFLNSKQGPKAGPSSLSGDREGDSQQIDIKFYQLALFFVILCIQGALLLPWMINLNIEHIWMFLFLVSIVIVSYMFVWASKGLDWKK